MKKGRLYNREEIELISKSAIGKSINDIAREENIEIKNDKDSNKGELGQLVEKYLFGIKTNNDSEPDFMPAGIELKVTPYKKLLNGMLSAKERLVFNVIDYMNEYKNKFKESHFWFKNNTIQLMWYLWEPKKDNKDLKFTNVKLLELANNEDLKQIEEDWNYIINKIKEGKAHELSEADTMYLGACSKGDAESALRRQPFSDVMTRQRAFCFKNSYMTQLVRKYIGDYSDVEKILKDSTMSFDNYVKSVTNKYIGKSIKELLEIFEISEPRDYSVIINKMFNVRSGLKETEEFLKANIIPKTIRMEENGRIIESISFPAFKFKDLVKESWETSKLKEELETTKYMFFVFKKENNDYIFKGFKLWNMPQEIIDNKIESFWNRTIDKIKNGVTFTIIKEKVYNDLPGMADNGIMHVRPHTTLSAYKLKNGFEKRDIKKYGDQLPNGEWMTKQCFWFNNTFIRDVLKEFND